ncbi:MAG: ABC-three component system protein [Oceanicaulis sp.]
MSDRINQKNIRAHNVAGRDVNINIDPNLIKQLESLADRLEKEMDESALCHQISDDLMGYGYGEDGLANKLEEKLGLAELNDRIENALFMKDSFRRSLERHIHFMSAQRIYTVIMAAILHKYQAYVIPLIKSGMSGDELYTSISELIVDPLANSMPASPLDADHTRIWGVLYFLTGNCFIWWSKR